MPLCISRFSSSRFLPMLASTLLGVAVCFGAAAQAQAQTDPVHAKAPVESGTDLHFHKFVPKVSPSLAANFANATDRVVDSNGFSRFALNQMNALQQEKAVRTPAQIKIDSNVLYTLRMLQGQDAAPGVPYLDTGVPLDASDNIAVDMVANVTDALLSKLAASGATVLNTIASMRAIRAIIPPAAMESIAASPDVIFISPLQEPDTNHLPSPRVKSAAHHEISADLAAKAFRIRSMLAQQIAYPNVVGTPFYGQGSVETEGDLAHQAVQARQTYGVTGAGIKIGVLSNGVTTAGSSQSTGDLPPTCGTNIPSPCLTILPTGQSGASGDEGTAMLEIVHDMVPGADLYFSTGNGGSAQYATNIRALQAAGCNIIVDDLSYGFETPMQDGQTASIVSSTNGGIVTQAVNDVVAAGVFYFSSAANSGSLDLGTSGTYEGDFNPLAAASPVATTGFVHNFGGGNGYDTVKTVTGTSGTTAQTVYLWWADPLGASSNDYDLYLLDATGATVLASSTNVQSGTQDPLEAFQTASAIANTRIVVYQKLGAANRFFHLLDYRAVLNVATFGETHGHAAASSSYGVAATPAAAPFSPSTPAGPSPNPFTGTAQTESFSSDGPRRSFFNADSTPKTQGNFSSTGGQVFNKPDITAADGVSVTGVGGFASPFYGTSAAAPTAASIAALILAAKPNITAAQMRTTLAATAIDIMGSGYDRDSGSGIVMPLAAVQYLGVPGRANPEFATITALENPGDGNGVIEAGEGAALTIQLKNTYGVLAATGISAVLTSSTPGIIVKMPGTSTYPDLAAGAGPQNNATPFLFTVSPGFGCGTSASFNLTLYYSSGQSRTLTFTVPIGQIKISNTLGSTASVPSGITFATGTVAAGVGRLFRTGTASVCGTTKTFPGVSATTVAHTFDSYTFQSCSASCLSPQVSSPIAGSGIIESVYSPSFIPTSLSTNYKADAGGSSALQTAPVTTVANAAYAVVVEDTAGNPPPTGVYTVSIPSCALKCSPYPLPNVVVKDVSTTANQSGGANVSIDNGSNDPNGGPITLSQTPAGPYQVGSTNVTLTVTNKFGAFTQATANVTVTTTSTKLVYIAGPPAYALVGGNPGIVKVAIEDVYGNINTAATDNVTLLITGPAGFTATPQIVAAVNGVATFNLTSQTLPTAGTYNFLAIDGLLTSAAATTTAIGGNVIDVLNANQSVSRVGTGGQPLNQSASSTTTTTGFIAVDANGVAWSAIHSGTLKATKTDGSTVSLPGLTAAGVNAPYATAVDGHGQIWVTNGNNSVSELDNAGNALSPSTGYTGVTIASSGGTTGYTVPTGIAIDLSGNVWVTNASGSTVAEILGAAAPAAPLSTAVTNTTVGNRP